MPTPRKNLEYVLAIVALVATAVPLGLWSMTFWAPKLSTSDIAWANFGTYVGGVLSPLLAFASFIGLLFTIRQQREAAAKQHQEDENKVYFDHAVACLARAFDSISADGRSPQPVRDRVVWLTCARLILSARDASARIAADAAALRTLYAGEVEYSRHKFRQLLQPDARESFGNERDYFQEDLSDPPMPIDERSARVIYEFMAWPSGAEDPIDLVPRYTPEEIHKLGVGKLGLRAALNQRRGAAATVSPSTH